MPVFLSRRWNRQPPYVTGVDWNNPLARGLVLATPGGTYQSSYPERQMTRTGTTIRAAQSGVVNGFGSTLGVGTTDSIITPLTAHATLRTYVVRVQRNGGGGGGADGGGALCVGLASANAGATAANSGGEGAGAGAGAVVVDAINLA